MGFSSLQHIQYWEPTYQGLPPLFVPLSGFDYPLNGLLLPKPLAHLSEPSARGIRPSELFSSQESIPLSRSAALLLFIKNPFKLVRLEDSFDPASELYSPWDAALTKDIV